MRVVRVLLVVLVLAVLAAGGAFAWLRSALSTPKDPTGQAPKVLFEVERGASARQVGLQLEAAGLIADARLWRLFLKLEPGAGAKAGKHEVSAAMSMAQLRDALAQSPISEDVPLTMVEGWRLVDADAALAAKGLIEPGAYLRAAQEPGRLKLPFELPEGVSSLEGYLLPETYMVPPGKLDVTALLQRQVEAFHQRFLVPYADELAKSPRPLRDLVIMASMLEREEPKPEVRPKVAGVLYKRLDAKTPLGVDATSRYTLESWNDRKAFLKKLRDPEDPYNSRLKAGLPPTAIGAPSLPSLVAALRPESSPYWYYLHDAQAEIHFGRTAEEHEANRKRYDVW
jgi:UPF0755 protein